MPIAESLSGDEYLGELALVNAAPGPRGERMSQDDRAAVEGKSLHVAACVEAGVSDSFLNLRFTGIVLEATSSPTGFALGEYLSETEQPVVTAAELGLSPALGKNHCYPRGEHPPDLRVCLPS